MAMRASFRVGTRISTQEEHPMWHSGQHAASRVYPTVAFCSRAVLPWYPWQDEQPHSRRHINLWCHCDHSPGSCHQGPTPSHPGIFEPCPQPCTIHAMCAAPTSPCTSPPPQPSPAGSWPQPDAALDPPPAVTPSCHSPVLQADEKEMGIAVANVVAFGTLGMLTYPYLAHALLGSSEQVSTWWGPGGGCMLCGI